MRTCIKCGKSGEALWLSKSGYCEECAEEILSKQTKAKPVYKKTWFWVIMVGIFLLVVAMGLDWDDRDNTNEPALDAAVAASTNTPDQTLQPSPLSTSTTTPTPKPFEPILINGQGDDVAREELGSGVFIANIQYKGDSNFSVWTHAGDDKDLTVNTIGDYEGSHVLWGGDTIFEVTASDSWSIEIDTANQLKTINASGHGDTCPGYYIARANDSGVYQITHNGERNFSVWMYTSTTTDLLVNEIGQYEGKKLIELSEGEIVLFQVTANGDWSIIRSD